MQYGSDVAYPKCNKEWKINACIETFWKNVINI